MSQHEKLLSAVLSGTRDKSLLFSDLQAILERLGFQRRIRGDHILSIRKTVWKKSSIFQPVGNKAKPYQVKQIRDIILKYRLGGVIHEV